MKEFIHKWSNWWILQPKRKQLDDAFEKELNELIEREVALQQQPVSKSLVPHRCPVCNGKGLVPNGFYMQTSGNWSTSSITPETCRSCSGSGIICG